MDLDGSESDETKKGQVGFFVTDGETPVLLELAEEHLDASPPAVNHLIVNDLDFAVFAPGNNGNVIVGVERAAVIVAVIAQVFDDITTNDVSGQCIGHRDVGHIATRQLTFDHLIVRRDGEMQLGGYPRAVFASGAVPPFEPPP